MHTATIATWGGMIAAFATAIATFFLWRVTKVLSVETKRMADVSAHPMVVADLSPNQWSTRHLDIEVQNTGNATAFDIIVSFDPPLTNGEARNDNFEIPFQKISLLKPGQFLRSYLSDVGDYLSKQFKVTVSWKLRPDAIDREQIFYTLNMGQYIGVSYLGERDPIIQIASQIKKLREDWRYVASGSRKIRVDGYGRADRAEERRILDERFGREKPPKKKTVPAKRGQKS